MMWWYVNRVLYYLRKFTGSLPKLYGSERRYVDRVKAPLSRATIIALRNELKSDNPPRFKKVKP